MTQPDGGDEQVSADELRDDAIPVEADETGQVDEDRPVIRLGDAIAANMNLHDVMGAGKFAKLAAESLKLPSIKIPDNVLKSIYIKSAIADHTRLLDAFKPALAAHDTWAKQFSVINSDIFRSTALAQANINLVSSQLFKNADFGFGDSFANIARQFAAQQSSWLKGLEPLLESMPFS